MPPSKASGAIAKKKSKLKSKSEKPCYDQHMVRDDALTDDTLMKEVRLDIRVPVQMYIPAEAEYENTYLEINNKGVLSAHMVYFFPAKDGRLPPGAVKLGLGGRSGRTTRRIDLRQQEDALFDILEPVTLRECPGPIKFVEDEAALRAATGSN